MIGTKQPEATAERVLSALREFGSAAGLTKGCADWERSIQLPPWTRGL